MKTVSIYEIKLFIGGGNISNYIQEGMKLSKKYGCRVFFIFNERQVYVDTEDSSESVMERYKESFK